MPLKYVTSVYTRLTLFFFNLFNKKLRKKKKNVKLKPNFFQEGRCKTWHRFLLFWELCKCHGPEALLTETESCGDCCKSHLSRQLQRPAWRRMNWIQRVMDGILNCSRDCLVEDPLLHELIMWGLKPSVLFFSKRGHSVSGWESFSLPSKFKISFIKSVSSVSVSLGTASVACQEIPGFLVG